MNSEYNPMAEEEGFEPPQVVKLLSVFETDLFSLLSIPPYN